MAARHKNGPSAFQNRCSDDTTSRTSGSTESDIHSVLQEQDEATRARRYRFRKQSEEKETYLLPETKEYLIVQVDEGRNW